MKAFVLMMVMHGQGTTAPVAEWFDTMDQCVTRLQEQAVRMAAADQAVEVTAFTGSENSHGILLASKRFVAWCTESRTLDPKVVRQIESAKKVP